MRKIVTQKQAECGGSPELIYMLAMRFFAVMLIACVIGCTGEMELTIKQEPSREITAAVNPEPEPLGLPSVGTTYYHRVVADCSITYLGQHDDYPDLQNASGITIDGSYMVVGLPNFVEQIIGDPNFSPVTPTHR